MIALPLIAVGLALAIAAFGNGKPSPSKVALASGSPSPTHVGSGSPSASAPHSPQASATPTRSPGVTPSPSHSATPTPTHSTTSTPTPTPTPTPRPSPTPTPTPTGSSFDDEFSGGALAASWVALNRGGDASNSELECYRPSNAAEGGGLLNLTTKVDSSCSGYQYTSAMVQWRSFNFLYGTIEVRAKLAGGTTWPSIWLLGANCQQTNITTADNIPPCNWPNPGSDEIDITEIQGSNQSQVNEQIHSSAGNPGCTAHTSDVSKNWHVYDLTWRSNSLVFKIDGVTTCTLTQAVPSHPMFLMLNTALGGIGGPVNNATLPQVSQFDYVRVTP